MVSDQMSLRRSKPRIARSREDHFLIAFEGNSQSFGSQDGREAVLDRNDFALFDSTRPYEVGFKPGFKHFVLKVPRSTLLSRLGHPHLMTGTRIRGDCGSGRLASRFFCDLQQELDGLGQDEANRLGDVGLDLLAAALAGGILTAGLQESAVRTAWLARIKMSINDRLAEPSLSPGTIAASLGISVRYLHSLFANEKLSIDRWIWERRLQKCHAALKDPTQHGRSISDIAFGWGFSEMSHFSRTYKRRFGCTPRDTRQQALSEIQR